MEPPIGYGLTYRSIFLESKGSGSNSSLHQLPDAAFIRQMLSFAGVGSRADDEAP